MFSKSFGKGAPPESSKTVLVDKHGRLTKIADLLAPLSCSTNSLRPFPRVKFYLGGSWGSDATAAAAHALIMTRGGRNFGGFYARTSVSVPWSRPDPLSVAPRPLAPHAPPGSISSIDTKQLKHMYIFPPATVWGSASRRDQDRLRSGRRRLLN